jgi:hypothetical protein
MRQKALEWWEDLKREDKMLLTKLILGEKVSFITVSEFEIIKMYLWQTR